MSRLYRCSVLDCGASCSSLRSLVHHVRSNHSLTKNINLSCPVINCSARYRSTESFRKHIEWTHRNEFNSEKTYAVSTPNALTSPSPDSHGHDADPVENFVMGNLSRLNADQAYNDLMTRLRSETVNFRLLLEHRFDLPTSTAIKIYDEAMFFACSLQRRFSEVISLRLKQLQIKDSVLDLMLDSPELENICKSTHGDITSMVESVGYVEPKEIDLIDYSKKNISLSATAKRPKMHYIPILSTLQSYLSHEDVLRAVLREDVGSDPSVLTNFTSGTLFKEHPLFSVDPRALRIILYTDELELCNPLGGNNKKHKMCVVYFQLANIGTKYLSSLQSIHLALMVKWNNVKTFSYSVVLKPLFDDLKLLANEGIQVRAKGGGVEHFRGAVAFVCGDNLTMHAIGGFQSHFSSGKVCRFCMTDYSALSSKSQAGMCIERTPDTHARHIGLVKEDEAMSSVYGVSANCVISEVPFLKVPYCLPPDIMHDILEKVMCLNMKIVLKGMNKSKTLYYSKVLKILSRFQFGPTDKVNKPPELSPLLMRKKTVIRGSAAQKWKRFYTFSLALGPHVPEGDKFWKLHLLLNEIVEIIFAITVTRDMVLRLELLVREHHNLYVLLVKGCYPPKLHYLLHYSQFMQMVGPLRHCWSMRFESFHQYFKRMSQKCNNFVHVEQTLSRRVQLKQCVLHSGDSALPCDVVVNGTQHARSHLDLPHAVKYRIHEMFPGHEIHSVCQVSSLTSFGLLVKNNCLVILDVVDGDPAFLLIKQIFIINNNEVFVYGSLVNTVDFNSHFHAYRIQLLSAPEDFVCVHVTQLLHGQTVDHYLIGNQTYVKLRFLPVKQ